MGKDIGDYHADESYLIHADRGEETGKSRDTFGACLVAIKLERWLRLHVIARTKLLEVYNRERVGRTRLTCRTDLNLKGLKMQGLACKNGENSSMKYDYEPG
jgi:hypothetical protein